MNAYASSAFGVSGESPEYHEWKTGDITVERFGAREPTFIFRQGDRIIARLTWPRPRQGRYRAEHESTELYLTVERMGYTMVATDLMTRRSKLIVNNRRNPKRARMTIDLDDSRYFVTRRNGKGKDERDFSLHIRREFYKSELIEVRFDAADITRQRTRGAARRLVTIRIHPVMRWEAAHFHHLLALIVGCVVFVGGHDRFKFDRKNNKYVAKKN